MLSHIVRARGRSLIRAGLIAGATAMIASAATAGECPDDKVKAKSTQPVTTPETGVADTVLASIDLANESIGAKGRTMRARRLTIAPGGVVSWHSHDDRPALIYVLDGEAVEYRNNCID